MSAKKIVAWAVLALVAALYPASHAVHEPLPVFLLAWIGTTCLLLVVLWAAVTIAED